MNLKHWLTALAITAVGASGPALQAGLFDRLRDRSESRGEERADEEHPGRAGDAVSFAVANEREIGRFVHPVTYQTLEAPAAIEGTLQPVPEPYLPGPGPSPVPSSSFYQGTYPGTPGEPLPAPGGPYPVQGGPLPSYSPEGYPSAGPIYPVGPGPEGMPLYHRVKYEDLDNVHPCGVPTLVQVLDPCENPCDSCGPRCVYVKICVPPNECPRVKVSHGGRKVKYKFDEYDVEIESEDGYVSVNYDD